MRETFRFTEWFAMAYVTLALAVGRVGVCGQPAKDASRKGFAPNVALTTADNVNVNLRDLAGDKIAVFHLLYTRCEACGSGMATLKEVQKELASEGRLGKDVVMFSITLDPEHDTAEELRAFAQSNDVKPGWTFLTGSAPQIQELREQLEPRPLKLSKKEQEAAKTLQHSGMLQIINGATGKRTSVSVNAKPDRILDLISRVQAPEP